MGEGKEEPIYIAPIIDLIANEYGWSLEQIYDLTKTELELLAKAIVARKNREMKLQGAMHGLDLEEQKPQSIPEMKAKIKQMGIAFEER